MKIRYEVSWLENNKRVYRYFKKRDVAVLCYNNNSNKIGIKLCVIDKDGKDIIEYEN